MNPPSSSFSADNAIKFTAKGIIAISVIELNNNNRNGEIQVNIKDTGTGLSPGILPKLFSYREHYF